jgi:predicted CoA-substrate-specific enzyme activase
MIANNDKLYFDGIEIGSVSVKWCRVYKNSHSTNKVLRHEGNPKLKLEELLSDNQINKNCTITGHSTANFITAPYKPETECIERALKEHKFLPDIILSLGGESFVVYSIKDGLIKNIHSSSKCAAGTGEFIIQQFNRMEYTLEEGLNAYKTGQKVDLAARCSVHCKSDATHKLNKGECLREDIAHTLIVDLAEKVHKLINISKCPAGKILLTGGLALNTPFITELKAFLNKSSITSFDKSHYIEAYGAALLSKDAFFKNKRSPQKTMLTKNTSKLQFKKLPPLNNAENLLIYKTLTESPNNVLFGEYILGVDAGSTTTKAVLINKKTYNCDNSCYLRTNGNPIEATKKCLQYFSENNNFNQIRISNCAVTGSGREVVSIYLNNAHSFNEILAHARAARQEFSNVDTIFEIGGQDSKYIHLLNGVPIDYIMNEGCSAGTGSFLEESALSDMNIQYDKISSQALKAKTPIAFGERCAAFINTDLRSALQQGAPQNDVLAGLVYSIADNYISRVVNNRYIGDTIFFQGGVALNKAVALALATKTGKKVIVPSKPELMGCIGAALMAQDKSQNETKRFFLIADILKNKMEIIGTIKCNSCCNKCEIKKIAIKDTIHLFGGLCSKFDNIRHRHKENSKPINLIDEYQNIMFQKYKPINSPKSKGKIGLPLALSTYELYPFYSKLISNFGYEVVSLPPSQEGCIKNLAQLCYPGELMHGAVFELLKTNIDYILIPNLLSIKTNPGFRNSYMCPLTSVIPDILKCTFPQNAKKILSPHYIFNNSNEKNVQNLNATIKIAQHLRIKKRKAIDAYLDALKHHNSFKNEYNAYSYKKLSKIKNQPVIIFAGRPYTIFSDKINMSIPQKIISRGFNVIPSNAIPFIKKDSHNLNSWYYTQHLMNAVKYTKNNKNYFLCFISCFSCGPDANIYHEIKKELSSKPFCYLEIDSHTAHAGIETRIEAFLEIIKNIVQVEIK